MKNQYTVYPFRLPFFLVLSVLLVISSLWIVQLIHTDNNIMPPRSIYIGPDYFIENFSCSLLSRERARYTMSGDLLIHNPDDNSFYVKNPLIFSLDRKSSPMILSADNAKIQERDSKIHLYGNVNADRQRTLLVDAFHLRSEYLLVLLSKNSMYSNKFVEIRLGKLILHGIGVNFSESKHLLRLSKAVNGTFPIRSIH